MKKMRKILSIFALAASQIFFSQVILGNNVGTAINKKSVLLEFANSNNKGIILPYVRTLPSSPTEGTIVLDASDGTKARVKYYNGTWTDLSGTDANITSELSTQPIITEDSSSKVILGSDTSTANGVLVLESDTKSLVLPIVDDVNKIPSPSPGMLVFVNKTGAKRLAVYNGAYWSFWKP